MRVLVCGGRNFGALPINKHPEISLKNGGYSLTDWDHPNINSANRERLFIYSTLDNICRERSWYDESPDGNWLPNITIISGAAKGVDSVAIDYAIVSWCQWEEYPADWKTHGKAAGPIRNQQMLDEGKPDLVIAFPGGRGTADMVRRAKKTGIEVIEVIYNNE